MSDQGWPPKLHRECVCDECRNFRTWQATCAAELGSAREGLYMAAREMALNPKVKDLRSALEYAAKPRCTRGAATSSTSWRRLSVA